MAEKTNLLRTVSGNGTTYELLSKGNVSSVIEKVRANYKARSFAEILTSSREVAGLFFHNWRQLSIVPEISVPVFADTNRPLSLPDALVREGKDAAGRPGVAFESIFVAAEPLLKQKLEAMAARMRADGINPDTMTQETFLVFFLKMTGILSGGAP